MRVGGLTIQAQRRRRRGAPIATATARRRSLQRMVRRASYWIFAQNLPTKRDALRLKILASDNVEELLLSLSRWKIRLQLEAYRLSGHRWIILSQLTVECVGQIRAELLLKVWQQCPSVAPISHLDHAQNDAVPLRVV